MPKTLMVSTCGTSLLTGLARPGKPHADRAQPIAASANATAKSATVAQREAINTVAVDCRGILKGDSPETVRQASAELNGLLGYYDNHLDHAQGDVHILLHSDTLQGETVAEILREYLARKHVNASVQSFSDLRTDTLVNFQSGLAGVIRWCQDTLPGYRASQYRIVFNLTGGFKSIQGWMQTLGMFYADEIIYIFESGGELLRIPRIPVDIGSAALGAIRQHLPLFRRLGAGSRTCRRAEVPDGVPEAFFYQVGDDVELSPWGQVVWQQARGKLYSEKLLDSPTGAIVFTERFKRGAGDRTPDQLAHVNERIDDFAAYLADQGKNPDRLHVRPLRGNPVPPSTHEFNAWAESPGWRVFFHTDSDGKKILDDLKPGMH